MDKVLRNRLDQALKREVQNCREHFRRDDWALDYSFLAETIINEVVGFDISSAILLEFARNFTLDFGNPLSDERPLLRSARKRRAKNISITVRAKAVSKSLTKTRARK